MAKKKKKKLKKLNRAIRSPLKVWTTTSDTPTVFMPTRYDDYEWNVERGLFIVRNGGQWVGWWRTEDVKHVLCTGPQW